jgi:CubicO group peptidase (beta-lactamase class C family)
MDTVSALGSVTKSFTAVVIMQLVEEGKLSLDDTIDTWFPDQPNADEITVRMLLSHTSGLANYISGDNSLEPRWAREYAPSELVAEANRLGPVDEPGSSIAHYSNTNYILLGLIIEAITGNSLHEEIRSHHRTLDLEHTASWAMRVSGAGPWWRAMSGQRMATSARWNCRRCRISL